MLFKNTVLILVLAPVVVLSTVLALTTSATLLASAEQEVTVTRERLLDESRERLKDYASLAHTAVTDLYAQAEPGDKATRGLAIARLSKMKYGADGYFIGWGYNTLTGTDARARRESDGLLALLQEAQVNRASPPTLVRHHAQLEKNIADRRSGAEPTGT